MSDNFLVCERCDFEWHRLDGEKCPICDNQFNNNSTPEFKGGMFGTGKKAGRVKLYYKALGMIALVYMIYFLLGN